MGTVVALGWDWLSKIDRSRMYDTFMTMNKSKNQYMKVEFMYSNHKISKLYSLISKTSSVPNPFPGMWGDWKDNKFGYLYNFMVEKKGYKNFIPLFHIKVVEYGKKNKRSYWHIFSNDHRFLWNRVSYLYFP